MLSLKTNISISDLQKYDFLLAFHNVPKTAGTSINFLMNENLGEKSLNIGIHSAQSRFMKNKQQFVDMNEQELGQIKFVQSHTLSLRDLQWFNNRIVLLMTVIRNPIERDISAFHHFNSEALRVGRAPIENIGQFLSRQKPNIFTHSILKNFSDLQSPDAMSDFEKVTSILERFQYVFTTEEIGSLGLAIEKILGFSQEIPKRRIGIKSHYSEEYRSTIELRNALDMAVYNWVRTKRQRDHMKNVFTAIQTKPMSAHQRDACRTDFYQKLSAGLIENRLGASALLKLISPSIYKDLTVDRELLLANLLRDWDLDLKNANANQMAILTESFRTSWNNLVVYQGALETAPLSKREETANDRINAQAQQISVLRGALEKRGNLLESSREMTSKYKAALEKRGHLLDSSREMTSKYKVALEKRGHLLDSSREMTSKYKVAFEKAGEKVQNLEKQIAELIQNNDVRLNEMKRKSKTSPTAKIASALSWLKNIREKRDGGHP
ncbi:MAG: sulfotransferase family 2 domain-containing protein [Flavimaricola sp.]|nr:sulfotransferase family 2 domain-containing protein [Flavimaricola sp.]